MDVLTFSIKCSLHVCNETVVGLGCVYVAQAVNNVCVLGHFQSKWPKL